MVLARKKRAAYCLPLISMWLSVESVVQATDGNFAIHRFPSVSCTVAFGLAPPKDEPGDKSNASHFFTSESDPSPASKWKAASSSSRIWAQTGTDYLALSARKAPSFSVLKRKAPVRATSCIPRRKSLSVSFFSGRPASLAWMASRLFIKSRPQRSGQESVKTPNRFLSCGTN